MTHGRWMGVSHLSILNKLVTLKNKEALLFNWLMCGTKLDGGEWAASCPSHFIPRERALGTHWIGDWVALQSVWTFFVKYINLLHLPGYIILTPSKDEKIINLIQQCQALRVLFFWQVRLLKFYFIDRKSSDSSTLSLSSWKRVYCTEAFRKCSFLTFI